MTDRATTYPKAPASAARSIGISRIVVIVCASSVLVAIGWLSTLTASIPNFDQACYDGQPWYVASTFRMQPARAARADGRGASVVLFRDTPDDGPSYILSKHEQTGAIWGLAYRPSERAVYAGAYHKRSVPHAARQTGAVHRIDLETGEVELIFEVPDTGRDRHRMARWPDGSPYDDEAAAEWVGRTSLGDLEVDDKTGELFVMNLADQHLYRLSLPTGAVLSRFENGAAAEPWRADARPFALMLRDGFVYHGVVNGAGAASSQVADIYRSRPDGTEMVRVARFSLGYTRERVGLRSGGTRLVDWGRWYDDPISSMPMITDIDALGDGDLVIALRDRLVDMMPQWVNWSVFGPVGGTYDYRIVTESLLGFGDLLHGSATGEGWSVNTDTERFDDTNAVGHEESATGGLAVGAVEPASATTFVAGAFGVAPDREPRVLGQEGAYWYALETGDKTAHEAVTVMTAKGLDDYIDLLASPLTAHADDDTVLIFGQPSSLGDIEALCPDVPPTPTATPTLTLTITSTPTGTLLPTVTPSPTGVPTESPEPTPTDVPGPIYLPIALTERCDPTRVRADVALVLDASSSMDGEKLAAAKSAAKAFIVAMELPEDRVGIATFSRGASILHPLSGDSVSLLGALDGLATSAGTRIDRGLESGLSILEDARRGSDVSRVLVLLTDGIQEAELDAPGLVADRIRADEILMHAIGLGTDVDAAYLLELVRSPDLVHISPTASELESIYTEIARTIPCPAEIYWGRRRD